MINGARLRRLVLAAGLMLTLGACGGETATAGEPDPTLAWGVPLTADIGTFVGLFFGSALLGEIVRRVRQRQRRDEEEALRVALEADQAYRTHKEALEIHESITSREVFDAMQDAGPDTPGGQYLLATYRRGRSRYLAFSDLSSHSSAVEELLEGAFDDIARLFPAELAEEQKAVTEKHERRSGDRTRYDVGSFGLLSKHHTLHVIEQRFCKLNGISTRADFEREFGAVVTEVVGRKIDKATFTGTTLLHDPEAATAAHRAKYFDRERSALEKLGAVRLDGVDYMAGWRVGFDKEVADLGRRIHQPVIQHFARLDGYRDITEVTA